MFLLIDGKKVRRLRSARDLTMQQLAERAKLSISAVQDIETRPAKKRRELTVIRLAKGLGVDPIALSGE
jgi:transcriptional regulator with XRE-family HTH domain